MLIGTLNKYLIVQDGPATTRPAQPAPKAAPTTQSVTDKSVGDQIREQIRAEIAGAAAQGGPAPPIPPNPERTITIRGRNGAQTVVGIPSYNANEVIPPQAVDISLAFFFTMAVIIIGLPLARAFARRMDRKSGPTQIPNEVSAQLAQLNQAVDAIALEVERISEGQRFTTRLLSEQRDAARHTLPSVADR
ncbi:MAG: hypothetical protein M3P26_05700 [Gemmatimonadota bacterium]|nr:hypothetical protein [Gemmatimonadota bacterium]